MVRGARISGDVEATGARRVVLRVRGNAATRIGADVDLERTRRGVTLARVVVAGDVELTGNRGGTALRRTRIAGDLECAGNRPAPTGARVVVRGQREGQCRRL